MKTKQLLSTLLILLSFFKFNAQSYTITTVVGTDSVFFSGDGGQAIEARIGNLLGVAVDAAGNTYIADENNNRIRKINTTGVITTIAGTGVSGFSGDGGLATLANLYNPNAVAVDAAGNVYISDFSNQRIRKINTSGIISTIAGTGVPGFSGDGGVATVAKIFNPYGVAVDALGNVYIADSQNYRIRKIDNSGIISTIAGTGAQSYSGDGGAATSAGLFSPIAVTLDVSGNLYITDYCVIRKIDNSGIISTVAGISASGYSGDGGAATAAKLNSPNGLTLDASGNLYIADSGNNRIRKVNTSGIISTVAGTGISGYSGDGGAATSSKLNGSTGVTCDVAGNLYIADSGNSRIRKKNTSGIISTLCGGSVRDGKVAIMGYLNNPQGVTVDATGNMYIADFDNNRIRKISTSGIISTIAGTGIAGFSGDGAAATAAQLYHPSGVAVDAAGNVYIADNSNSRIRKVNPSGIISTVAGTGLLSNLYNPNGVAVDALGNVYITDSGNNRILKIDLSGNISTIAGTGTSGFSGDGGLATSAKLYDPMGIAVDAAGNIYIADTWNGRIRKINSSGIISSIAGIGTQGYSGDGGAATSAKLNYPHGLSIDVAGNVYIADKNNSRIRKINTSGIINTIAGTGTTGFSGDGGLATSAKINQSAGLVVDNSGNVYIADNANIRIRKLTTSSPYINVWPGDANSDGVADNLDVLELGLHYTQTGPARSNTSNTWQAYFANNWTGAITNGKNLNHSDCNGDGIINDDDTLAIYNNYGLTHALKPVQTNTLNPQLTIVPDQAAAVKGTWGTASIYLGDASNTISNINGVAFTVDFDNTLIETNNIWIEYLPSFIDASQNLHFRKLDFVNDKIYTASTHTLSNNVSGFGKIVTLHYQIKSSLVTDQVLNLGITQANQSDASGLITPLTSGTGTLLAMGTSVGLQELNGNVFSISPNPTNGSLTINSKTELQKVEVMSVDGKVLLSETPTNVSHTLHLDNLANGIYFVNLYQNNRVMKREKIVLNK